MKTLSCGRVCGNYFLPDWNLWTRDFRKSIVNLNVYMEGNHIYNWDIQWHLHMTGISSPWGKIKVIQPRLLNISRKFVYLWSLKWSVIIFLAAIFDWVMLSNMHFSKGSVLYPQILTFSLANLIWFGFLTCNIFFRFLVTSCRYSWGKRIRLGKKELKFWTTIWNKLW